MASQAVEESARSMAGSVKNMFRKANEMLHLGVVTNLLFLFGSETERMHAQGSSTTEDIETGRPPADRSRGEVSNEDSPALRSLERVTIVGNHGDVLELASGSHGIQAGSEVHPTFHEANLNLTNRSTGREVGEVGPTRNGTPNEIQPQRTARDDAEATKHARKVAQVTIAAASSGIITLIIGVLAIEQLKHAYSLHMKICVLFLLASFVSAACLILHAGSLHMRIVKTLVTTTLGALVLAVVYVVVAFLTLVD